MINLYHRPNSGLSGTGAVCLLVLFLLVSTVSISQTKPAAAKSATAKPAAAKSAAAKPVAAKPAAAKTSTAKKSSTAAAAKKTSAKPSATTSAARTSGQNISSQPAPARAADSDRRTPASSGSATKTANAPVNGYKAQQNTAAAPQPALKKVRSYGQGFNQNDKLLNVGIGLSSYYYGTPIGVSFEAAVHKDISVGVQLDYNSGRYNDYYYSSYRWGYKAYYLGARASYHFNRLLKIRSNKLDVYAGVGLGYQSFRWNDRSYGYGYNYGSGLFYNYFVGGKFYFTPQVAAFAELGYTGLSSSRVGIAFKF